MTTQRYGKKQQNQPPQGDDVRKGDGVVIWLHAYGSS